jgi:hypothetical protein
MRLAAAKDDIFYLAGIQFGSLPQHILNAVSRQIVWARHIKRSAK